VPDELNANSRVAVDHHVAEAGNRRNPVKLWGKWSRLTTQTVFVSPLLTGIVTVTGGFPTRDAPRILHAPIKRLVVSAQAPPVRYSWRLKSASGHLNVIVAVPLRVIVTSIL